MRLRMTDATVDEPEAEEKKSSKLPLIIGLVLAVAGGGGGFFAVSSGLLGGAKPTATSVSESHAENTVPAVEIDNAALSDISFVEVPPLVISLGPGTQADHLRFRASLEVNKGYESEIEGILPRIQDVMNSYLRALEPATLEEPGALLKLRSQMLRRVSMVAGEGRVRDLLVLEFVLN